MHTRHKHTKSAWKKTTHSSHTRVPTAPRVTIQTENTTSITSLAPIYNILQHSNAKTLCLTTSATQQQLPQPPVTTTIRTFIAYRLLARRGNNKILRTLPPLISSSEEILSRLTRRILAKLRTHKSHFLKSYLHKVDAKSHPSPLCPIYNTHTHSTHHLFNPSTYAPHCHPWIYGQTLQEWWTERLAGGPPAGRLDCTH